jgi:hypothetical protein
MKTGGGGSIPRSFARTVAFAVVAYRCFPASSRCSAGCRGRRADRECVLSSAFGVVAVRVVGGSWLNVGGDAGWVAVARGWFRRVKGCAAWLLLVLFGGGRRRWHLWCVANVPSYGMKKRGGGSIPRSFALTVAFVVGADRLFWMSSLAGRPDGMTATQLRGCGGVRPAVADVPRTGCTFCPRVLWVVGGSWLKAGR